VPAIAKVAFTSEDRVRDVIRNFNADGFDSLYPKYRGGRAPKFTLPQRREIKKIAKSRPADYDLPFSTWSLAKLADFLVAEGVVDDISHEGLRALLREEGVTFQRLKTWKTSKDPDYQAKKARVEHLYAIADRDVAPGPGDPQQVVICVDEFGAAFGRVLSRNRSLRRKGTYKDSIGWRIARRPSYMRASTISESAVSVV
jgi:transposase